MFWTTVTDPTVGNLRYWWGLWRGRIHLDGHDVQLRIESAKRADVQPFLARIASLISHFSQFKEGFAPQLFDDYCLYKRGDIEEGGFHEEDYLPHPTVQSPAEVWQVLKPYQLWHGNLIDRHHGNAYLAMYVDWPNPHYFQVFFQLGEGTWEYRHTELVG